MAFHYSPKIVNSGLILYIDAANNRSIIGTNSIYDISNTQNTLVANNNISLVSNHLYFRGAGPTGATTSNVDYIYVGGTNAGVNGIYTDVLRYAANGLPWVMGSGGGTSSLDQYARDTANNASSNTIIIQGVDVSQNARMTIIEGTDVTQNTRITVVEIKAQAAFDQANTGGGGGATANLTSVVDTFTGNGYTTAFSLSVTPISINYTTAVVGGVSQPRSAYSVVGTTLTFTSAPENGQIIEVTTLFGGGSNVTSAYVENSNSVILVTNTVITGNCTVAANTGGLSVGPVVINTSQTVTVANNARWVIL